MNILKKFTVSCAMLAIMGMASPSFAATATIDVDEILAEYSKSKIVSAQFRAQEESLQKIVTEAQNKVKAATSPVEKQNIEKTYEAKFNAQAEKIKNEQMKKLQEIETDIFNAIDKVNNGKYDLILKKSATVYCPNDITADVLKKLNGK